MHFGQHIYTVSQIHECTVAHIAMLLLAKARPHNVSHSSSYYYYCTKSRHCAILDTKGNLPRVEPEVISEVSKNSAMTKLRSITAVSKKRCNKTDGP